MTPVSDREARTARAHDVSAEVRDLAPRVGTTLAVLLVLLVLTAATAGLAFVPLGSVLHVIVAATIAALKAGLVVAYFMHLTHEGRLIRTVAAAGLLWLAIMVLFIALDLTST